MTTAHITRTPATAADRYLADRVMTASRAELTGMLYDACVAAIKGAIRLQEDGEHLASIPRIRKAQDIVMELRVTLNHNAGGKLASHLDALYAFIWSRLLDCSVHRDIAAARAALDVIEPIADAWRTACLSVAA